MISTVIDTNVFVSALISHKGLPFKLLSLAGTGQFDINLSIPLVLEYESSAKRLVGSKIALSDQEVDDVIDYLCLVGKHRKVYFLWRPTLRDAHDDMVLELAINAECEFIVTYNVRDFRGVERFGFKAVTPAEFFKQIGVAP